MSSDDEEEKKNVGHSVGRKKKIYKLKHFLQ